MPSTVVDPAPVRRMRRTGRHRADLIAAAGALGLVAVACAVGVWLNHQHKPWSMIYSAAPPLYASWFPHVGPGTPAAILIALLVVLHGPDLAARLPWRRTLLAGYLASVGWTFALAMIDGWQPGIAGRLTTRDEYLHEVPGITDIPAMLRGFTAHILDYQPDSWTTHVSGHPPGATLVFVWLDRIGLRGGGWAGVFVILVGCLATVAVPVTLRALGTERMARSAVPFLVLFPGAVWVGVSADGMFAGVTSAGVALVAVATRARPAVAVPAGLLGGLALGYGVYLSYGLLLFGLVPLAVIVLRRSPRALMPAGAGVLAVVAAFTLAGFNWIDGYHLVVQRYYQGIGAQRPYPYWVWADLAALVLAIGPATVAGLRRATVSLGGRRFVPVAVLAGAAAIAIAAADLSGLSKAEVERIWLPFAVWLVPTAALLPAPSRRWWLIAQAALALLVNHLVFTNW